MKKRVFLTGATGTMGWAGLMEFMQRLDRFDMTILARPSKKNKEKLAPYADRIRIVWGDLTKYEDVLEATKGADYVLHVGGMVSPAADYFPNKTRRVNVLAAKNVSKAVLAQPNADSIKVCYIGSVAQTSDRNEPIHWGRTGDPICISVSRTRTTVCSASTSATSKEMQPTSSSTLAAWLLKLATST